MKRKENLLLSFVIFLCLSLLVLGLSKIGFLNPVSSVFQKIAIPFQRTTYNLFNSAGLKKLENENIMLTSMLADQKKLERENSALSDQFQVSFPKSSTLLPANIIGAPSFVPGVSLPEKFIIDKGKDNGVKIDQAVVYRNNLIGKITVVNDSLSEITLVTNSSSSFTARASSSQAQGVIKGQGKGQMILDNVLLSENLKSSDLVLTNGDTSLNGTGFPPDLVVGKIISVDKKASSLFQRAEVSSFIDFSKIKTVYILVK